MMREEKENSDGEKEEKEQRNSSTHFNVCPNCQKKEDYHPCQRSEADQETPTQTPKRNLP